MRTGSGWLFKGLEILLPVKPYFSKSEIFQNFDRIDLHQVLLRFFQDFFLMKGEG